MKRVILAENSLAPETWERHDVQDVRDFLMSRFNRMPDTARIYHGEVAEINDVTPSDEGTINRLGELPGPFYIIVYPGEPVTIIIAIVAVAAIAAAAFLLAPVVPNPSLKNNSSPSPNNELSNRSNSPRVNGRIPDIFGEVRSTPDLIAVPYKVFENDIEVEYAYMCIGRGAYDVSEIKDGDTLISEIVGSSVDVFAPNTSPNSGSPQLSIGSGISDPVWDVVRSNSVNGQILHPITEGEIIGAAGEYLFEGPNKIIRNTSQAEELDIFSVGDSLIISLADGNIPSGTPVTQTAAVRPTSNGLIWQTGSPNAAYVPGNTITVTGSSFTIGPNTFDLDGVYTISGRSSTALTFVDPILENPNWEFTQGATSAYDSTNFSAPGSSTPANFDGTYLIASVSADLITLSSPATVNSAWTTLNASGAAVDPSPTMKVNSSAPKWIGPFFVDKVDATQVWLNFVALNGLYRNNKKGEQKSIEVDLEVGVTPVDAAGVATGGEQLFDYTLIGSADVKSTKALTAKIDPSGGASRWKVRARRVTDDLTTEGEPAMDEIKWRDLYAVAPVSQSNFGNITTVQSVTIATAGALSVKERKLNMLVTRKVYHRTSGSTFGGTLLSTKRADDILSFICKDPYIGNRVNSEIDFDSIYDTIDEVESYFGTDIATEFSYTFDSDDVSFEETVASLVDVIFCKAYRRGNVIKLSFEKETANSTLLFNHRNKLPGSETRTIRFGNQEDFDGVSLDYVSPEDDAVLTYYIPSNMSAINPKKVETVGIRNKLQAYFHAWRAWNKIRYQNLTLEFEATQEADLLVIQDRILVADNTRPNTQDGEIVSQNVLVLQTSQPVSIIGSSTIFLQLYNGTVQSIGVTQGVDEYHVILAGAPTLPLALDDDLFARTTYIIVENSSTRQVACLLTEKSTQSNFVYSIKAANYDDRYYQNDVDYINGDVDEEGN